MIMTINTQNNSINFKYPAQDAKSNSVDILNTIATTEIPQPTESTDQSPQGMPSEDAKPHTPVPPAAAEVAESSGPGTRQGLTPADAGPKSIPTEYACPQVQNTPATLQTSHSNCYRNGSLEERLENVVQTIQQVDIIDVDFFFSNLLPMGPKTVCLDAVIEDLETKDLLSKVDGQSSWTVFEETPFLPFTDIFKVVVSSAKKLSKDPLLKVTHSFKMESNNVPNSDRDGRMRPGTCFVRESPDTDSEKKTSWLDIACVGELKTGEERKDNIDKVIYGMHYIMASDPCRRFVTGFTVEKDTMALWFSSRSALYKCVFDYKKEPDKLVRLFMAFAFADANGQETGWDPTVKPVVINKERQYIYDVGGTKYVTKRLLAEYAAESLFGRATRVFLVTEEGKNDEHVLKDYWVDEGRSFEFSTVEGMLEDVKNVCGEEAKDLVKRHIVTILKERDVEVGNQVDHTLDVMMRGMLPEIIDREDLMSMEDAERDEELQRLNCYGQYVYVIVNKTQNRPTSFRKMRHRRVVYKEYGTPIDEVKQLSEAIAVLHGVTEALKYIHAAEWVHRDISAGNIYEYGGRGLLADFEYAKKMGKGVAHEMKAGTSYFMASEAIERTFYYHVARGKAVAEFFHNVIHDMESIHWVIFFLLKDVDCKDEKAQDSRILIDCKLFIAAMSRCAARLLFVSSPSATLYAYELLLGDDGKEVYDRFSELGEILCQYYRAAEANFPDGPIDITKFSGIHEEFLSVWVDCKVLLAKQDKLLKVKPAVMLPPPAPKRKAETELQCTRESKMSRTQPILEEDEMSIERI